MSFQDTEFRAPLTRFPYGQHKGRAIEDVAQTHPSYIVWAYKGWACHPLAITHNVFLDCLARIKQGPVGPPKPKPKPPKKVDSGAYLRQYGPKNARTKAKLVETRTLYDSPKDFFQDLQAERGQDHIDRQLQELQKPWY